MELTQQLSNVEQLIPILQSFQKNRQATIDQNQQELLRKTYYSIYGIQPSLSCGTCVIEHLHQLLAWYEKHSGKPIVNAPVPENKSNKGCNGCKKKI